MFNEYLDFWRLAVKNYIGFVEKNVVSELLKSGYDPYVAKMSAYKATEHYKRSSSASAKGKLFADCLTIGENWAKKMQPKIR